MNSDSGVVDVQPKRAQGRERRRVVATLMRRADGGKRGGEEGRERRRKRRAEDGGRNDHVSDLSSGQKSCLHARNNGGGFCDNCDASAADDDVLGVICTEWLQNFLHRKWNN